jgi:type IV secretion system protein VirB4
MESFINILSGRAETVAILDELMNEFGEDPIDWLPIFNEKLNNTDSK